MSDGGVERFGSPERLLKEVQERSDDIEKAVIMGPGWAVTDEAGRAVRTFPTFNLVFCFVNGEQKIIHPEDAEMVLNDGILTRMRIKIEFGK